MNTVTELPGAKVPRLIDPLSGSTVMLPLLQKPWKHSEVTIVPVSMVDVRMSYTGTVVK